MLSSDRPPHEIPALEERLRSRFEWGLIADIQPPDIETRMAILKRKAEAEAVPLPDNVALYIAGRIKSNIRELEGALNQVLATSRLTHQSLTPEVVEEALNNLLPQHRKLAPDQIIDEVAKHFGIEVNALRGRNRSRAVARPRQIAMYLIREETGESLPRIGALLGGRDHTTILHGCERIADLMERDSDIRREVVSLCQHLYSNGR